MTIIKFCYLFNYLFGHSEDTTKDQVADRKPILKREKSGVTEPVIIPIVLKMAEFDHKVTRVMLPYYFYMLTA